MSVTSSIIDLAPMTGAGIQVYAKWPDVAPTIRATFDRLYKPGSLVPGHGHNFILYSNETKEGGTLLIGVLDREPGGNDPDVKAVHIPGGRTITALGTVRVSATANHAAQVDSIGVALGAGLAGAGLARVSREFSPEAVVAQWRDLFAEYGAG